MHTHDQAEIAVFSKMFKLSFPEDQYLKFSSFSCSSLSEAFEFSYSIMFLACSRLVVCLAYYGLALNSGDIGGDMYLNFFLQSFMDLPGSIFIILFLDKIGRRPMMVGTMLLGGVGCLATVFTIIYGGNGMSHVYG